MMHLCWRQHLGLFLTPLFLLTAGQVWAEEPSSQENSYTQSVRDRAYGSLLETAGQPDRAFALYRQAWAAFRQDEVMQRILVIARSGAPNRMIVEFLENAESEVADQELRTEVRDYLEAIRAIMLSQYGRIVLRTFPKEARVSLSSATETRRFESGQALWLMPGQCLFRSTSSGHLERTHILNIEAGVSQEIVLILQPKDKGSLINISTTSEHAIVSIDGVVVGQSPIRDFQIRQGSYVVTAVAPGHLPYSHSLLVSDSTPVNVNMVLEPTRKATRKDLVVAMNTNRIIRRSGDAIKDSVRKKRDRKKRTRRFSPLTEQVDPGDAWRLAGWVTTGFGVALVGGSFYIATKASEEAQLAGAVPAQPEFDAEFEEHAQKYTDYTMMYFAGLGVGALSITGGLLMVFLAPENEDLAFDAAPVNGGGMVRSTIRF